MFKAEFIRRRGSAIFVASYGQDVVTFEIDKLYNERNVLLLQDPERMEILSLYINEYNIAEPLMKLYHTADKHMKSTNVKSIVPIVSRIIKLFDYTKYYDLIIECGFKAPKDLDAEIPKSRVRNGRITVAQTYTKSDYLELLPIIGIIKAIGPIFANDIKKNVGLYPSKLELLVLGNNTLDMKFEKKPLQKVIDFIDTHISSTKSDDELLLVGTKKRIDKSDINIMVLGNALYKRLFPIDVPREPESTVIIKNIYSASTSGTSVSSTVEGNVKFKNLNVTADTGDKEGWIESFRKTSAMTMDEPENMNFIASDPYACSRDLGVEDIVLIPKFLKSLKPLVETQDGGKHAVCVFSIWLLELIMTDILPPKALPYLTRENLLNLLAVGANYATVNGLERLAPYFSLTPDYAVDIHIPGKIDQVSKDRKLLLMEMFPHCKEVRTTGGGIKEEFLVIDGINGGVDSFKSEQYNHLLDTEYSEAGSIAIPYKEMKDDIAKLILLSK